MRVEFLEAVAGGHYEILKTDGGKTLIRLSVAPTVGEPQQLLLNVQDALTVEKMLGRAIAEVGR
jgi:hypothetical protein